MSKQPRVKQREFKPIDWDKVFPTETQTDVIEKSPKKQFVDPFAEATKDTVSVADSITTQLENNTKPLSLSQDEIFGLIDAFNKARTIKQDTDYFIPKSEKVTLPQQISYDQIPQPSEFRARTELLPGMKPIIDKEIEQQKQKLVEEELKDKSAGAIVGGIKGEPEAQTKILNLPNDIVKYNLAYKFPKLKQPILKELSNKTQLPTNVLDDEERAYNYVVLNQVLQTGKPIDSVKKELSVLGTPAGRIGGSFVQGILAIPQGLAGMQEYVGEKMGNDWLKLSGQYAANNIQKWIEKIAPENPNFAEQMASGIGSQVIFLPFGIGAATLTRGLMRVSPKLANWFGASAMTFLESATEAGQVYLESKDTDAAEKTMLANLLVLGITNKLGIFNEKITDGLKRILVSSGLEGLQEATQEVISKKSQGKDVDITDVVYSGIIGSILGGGGAYLSKQQFEKILEEADNDPVKAEQFDKIVRDLTNPEKVLQSKKDYYKSKEEVKLEAPTKPEIPTLPTQTTEATTEPTTIPDFSKLTPEEKLDLGLPQTESFDRDAELIKSIAQKRANKDTNLTEEEKIIENVYPTQINELVGEILQTPKYKQKQAEERKQAKLKAKLDQDNYSEIKRLISNAKRKRILTNVDELNKKFEQISNPEIKSKAQKELEDAGKYNANLEKRNQLTIENIAYKRYGTDEINKLTEDQQLAVFKEYNELKKQGIKQFRNIQPETKSERKGVLSNAIQEPSTEEILQRQQGTVGETGGERGQVEQGIEGIEPTRESIEEKLTEEETETIPTEETTGVESKSNEEAGIEVTNNFNELPKPKSTIANNVKVQEKTIDVEGVKTRVITFEQETKAASNKIVKRDYKTYDSVEDFKKDLKELGYEIDTEKSGFENENELEETLKQGRKHFSIANITLPEEDSRFDTFAESSEGITVPLRKIGNQQETNKGSNIIELDDELKKYNKVSDNYFVNTKVGKGNKHLQVKGEKVFIPEAPEYDFFVYEDDRNGWAVAEGITGLKISYYFNTKEQAIKDFKKKLYEEGRLSQIPNAIKLGISYYGLSPRYAEKKADGKENNLAAIKRMVNEGKSDKEIAEALNLSISEVKNIREKYNINQSKEKEEDLDEKETSDIEAITNEAETVIQEEETDLTDGEASETIEEIDTLVNDIDEKLKLLGYYDNEGETTKDMKETGSKLTERRFRNDLNRIAKELKRALGYEDHLDKKGRTNTVSLNIAPSGGDGTIILWKPNSNYGVYIDVKVEQDITEETVKPSGNSKFTLNITEIMWRATSKDNVYGGFENQWEAPDVSIKELAEKIKKEVDYYESKKIKEYTPDITKTFTDKIKNINKIVKDRSYQEWDNYKKKNPDNLVWVRLGDFYVTYDKDARDTAKLLGIHLAEKYTEGKDAPYTGFPMHALDTYFDIVKNKGRSLIVIEDGKIIKETKKEGRIEEEPTEYKLRKEKNDKNELIKTAKKMLDDDLVSSRTKVLLKAAIDENNDLLEIAISTAENDIVINKFYSQYEAVSNDNYTLKADEKFYKVDNSSKVENLYYGDGYYFVYKNNAEKLWSVTEGLTGRRIGKGKTKKQAIENAKLLLQGVPVSNYVSDLNKYIEKNGLSPKYEKVKSGKNIKSEIEASKHPIGKIDTPYIDQAIKNLEEQGKPVNEEKGSEKKPEVIDDDMTNIIKDIENGLKGITFQLKKPSQEDFSKDINPKKIVAKEKIKVYFNSHGYDYSFKDFVELEVEERGNYSKEFVKKIKQKYNIKDTDRAIWVTPNKRVALSYYLTANMRDEILSSDTNISENDVKLAEFTDKDGFIIPETNDGDEGFLMILRPLEGQSFQLKPGQKIPADIQTKANELIGRFVEKDITKFDEIIKIVEDKFGQKTLERIFPALKAGYTAYLTNAPEDIIQKMDTFDYVRNYSLEKPAEESDEEEKPGMFNTFPRPNEHFIQRIREEIRAGNILNKTQLENIAKEYEIENQNLAKEYAEVAVVLEARKVINEAKDEKDAYDNLLVLYNNQPNLTHRTSNSIEKQQYSTPAPISYVAGLYVADGVGNGDVLEPSAGNGLLTIAFDPAQVSVNEIDGIRVANLWNQGYDQISMKDASTENNLFEQKFEGMITNPPFGSIDMVRVDGFKIKKLEHLMAINGLKQLKDGGRAAIIIGGHNEYDNHGRLKTDREFFNWLYHFYNVDAVLNINGELYRKQGTQYPIRLILVNGKKSNPEGYAPLYNPEIEIKINSFEELYNKMKEIRDEAIHRPKPDAFGIGNVSTDVQSPRKQRDKKQSGTETILGGQNISTSGESGTISGGVGQSANRPGSNISTPTDKERPSIPDSGKRPIQKDDIRGFGEQGGGVESGRNRPSGIGEDISSIHDTGIPELSGRDILKEEKAQLPYIPKSKGISLQIVIPKNMYFDTMKTLENLEYEVGGDIDEFVREKLQYQTKEELYSALFAEQIDAVALGIRAIEKHEAFIIGDMAGIGKGRVAASLIRYARLKNYKPIFFTKSADLFTDLYRDMKGIGSQDLVPFILNNDAKSNILDENGDVVYEHIPNGAKKYRIMDGDLSNYDYIVTTYSQFSNPEKYKNKVNFLYRFAENNVLIMDESHKASGKESNTNKVMMEVVANSGSPIFLSATYSKEPANMPIYAIRTAMREAELGAEALTNAIIDGGVALQEIIAAEIISAGQMIRRERSFEGIKTEYKIYSKEQQTKFADKVDSITSILRKIIRFQKNYAKPYIDDINTDVDIITGVRGTEKLGINNAPFASKIFQVIHQMLFSLKADDVAEDAIRLLKEGKKPVIAFASTMETFLKDMELIREGETINDDFSVVLERGLRSILRYSIKSPEGDTTTDEIDINKLGKDAVEEYNTLMKEIKDVSSGLSISPIDRIIEKIEAAGYKVGEMTGRDLRLVKDEKGRYTIYKRKSSEKNFKTILRHFNNWEEGNYRNIDVLLINRSASTGISAHAAPEFKDQRPRVMISMQIELDINEEIQKRMRIFRTGQVVNPEYLTVSSFVPAEQRLLMMAKRKLKSLDANTSSDQSKAEEVFQNVDFLNKYGDMVVFEYLKENPQINEMLTDPLKLGDKSKDELDKLKTIPKAAHKVTGYVALLPTKMQEEFYNEITHRYLDYIEHLESLGENDLYVKVLPYDAKTLSTTTYIEGNPNSRTSFGKDVVIEKVEVNVLKKPYKMEQVKGIIEKYLKGKSKDEYRRDILAKFSAFREQWMSEHQIDRINNMIKKLDIPKNQQELFKQKVLYNRWFQEIIEDVPILQDMESDFLELFQKYSESIDHLNKQFNYVEEKLKSFAIGDPYYIPNGDLDKSYGIFVGFKINEKRKNPFAPSAIALNFVVSDTRQHVQYILSDREAINNILWESQEIDAEKHKEILTNWDNLLYNRTREIKYIATGNILKAIAQIPKSRNLITYTTSSGEIKRGLLVNDKNVIDNLNSNLIVKLKRAIELETDKSFIDIEDMNNEIRIYSQSRGIYIISVPASKSAGGKYYLDKKLQKFISNEEFFKSGNRMIGYINSYDTLLELAQYLDETHGLLVSIRRKNYNSSSDDTSYRLSNVKTYQDNYGKTIPAKFTNNYEYKEGHPYLKDKIISIIEPKIVYWTREQILSTGYSNNFINTLPKLKEGDFGYEPGKEKFAVEITEATEYNVEGGRTRISISSTATPSAFTEGLIHAIYKEIEARHPELISKIRRWERIVSEEAKKYGIEIPEGYETFAQALTFTHLGYAEENPDVAELFEIPRDILAEVNQILNMGEYPISHIVGESKRKVIRLLPSQDMRMLELPENKEMKIGWDIYEKLKVLSDETDIYPMWRKEMKGLFKDYSETKMRDLWKQIKNMTEKNYQLKPLIIAKNLSPDAILNNYEGAYPTPLAVKDAKSILGDELLETYEFYKRERGLKPADQYAEGLLFEEFARTVVVANRLNVDPVTADIRQEIAKNKKQEPIKKEIKSNYTDELIKLKQGTSFQLKKPKSKTEGEIYEGEPETILDFGMGLGNAFSATASKLEQFIKNYQAEKELGITDPQVKRYYREFLTAPQWFADKEPQLQVLWDIIDRKFVRHVNEDSAILIEDKWLNGKAWRKLPEPSKKEILEALKDYEETQYDLYRHGLKFELLGWQEFVDEYNLSPDAASFIMNVYKPIIDSTLDMVKEMDKYKIVHQVVKNPYLEDYYIENKLSSKDKLKRLTIELEKAKNKFFTNVPNAEFLFEQELLKMKKAGEKIDEVVALERTWQNNERIRFEAADHLIEEKYKEIDGKIYLPTSRLNHKYFLSMKKMASPAEKLIMKLKDEQFFKTSDSLPELKRLQEKLEGEGYELVAIGKFSEAKEELLRNEITQEELLNLAILTGIDSENPEIEKLLKTIQAKGFTKRFIHKRYIPGFDYTSENFEKTLYNYMRGVAFFTNRSIGQIEFENKITELKQKGILRPGSSEDHYLHNLQQRIEGQDVKVSTALRAVASVYHLALSIPYYAQQIVQPLNTLLPMMPIAVSEINKIQGIKTKLSSVDGEKAFARSIVDVIPFWLWKIYDKINRVRGITTTQTFGLDKDFLDVIRSLDRQGVGKPLRSLEMTGHLTDPYKHYSNDLLSKTTSSISAIAKIWSIPGIAVEDFTRAIGIRAFYLLGKKAGLKGEKLKSFISFSISRTYSPASGRSAKPPGYYIDTEGKVKPIKKLAQSIVESWLTFKNFAFMNYGQWGKMYRAITEGEHLLRPAIYKLSGQFFTGGFKYMMWTSTILTILTALFDLFDIPKDPEEEYEKLFLKFNDIVDGLGDALYKGVSTITFKIDFSSLFAQTAPIEEPFTKDTFELITGAPGGAVRNIVEGKAPRFARGIQQVKKWEEEGIKFGSRQLVKPEDITEEEKTKRKIGFQPSEITQKYSDESYRKFKSSQYTDIIRKKVEDEIIPLIQSGKDKEARQIFKQIYDDMLKDNVITEAQAKRVIGVNTFISNVVLSRLEPDDREIIKNWKNNGTGTINRGKIQRNTATPIQR